MFFARESVTQLVNIIHHLHPVANENQVDGLFSQLTAEREKPMVVSWLNANVLNIAQKNPDLAASLLQSRVLLRDGAGISLLLRMIGEDSGFNMNGTDYIPKILRLFAGRPIALLGTCEPYLSKAAAAAEKLGCRVILCMDGFQEPEEYLRRLAEHDVDTVVLGMGVPKQERVSIFLADRLARPVLILNGGAILDFMAGRFPRAPRIWRTLRLEWLFRLIQEPGRLWRRYIIGIPLFLFNTMRFIYTMKFKRLLRQEG